MCQKSMDKGLFPTYDINILIFIEMTLLISITTYEMLFNDKTLIGVSHSKVNITSNLVSDLKMLS